MSMMAAETAGENRGGKKIAGMPRNVVLIGVVALVGGIAWFWYKRKGTGAASSAGGSSGGQIIGYDANGNPIISGSAQTPADFSGELSTLQSEFGSLASEIAQMQGSETGEKPPPPKRPPPKRPPPKRPPPKKPPPKGKKPPPKPKPKPKPKPRPRGRRPVPPPEREDITA